MQVVIDNNEVLTKAHNRFKTFTKNDELVELYEARQKYKMDRDSAISYAEMKGIEKGIEKGLYSAVERLKNKGLSAEKIEALLDVPVNEVKKEHK